MDRFDLVADVFGRFSGFLGQFLDFVGDDREALAGFAGPGGFDGGVERQQIGLLGDRSNDLDDLADFRAAVAQLGDRAIGAVRRGNRLTRYPSCVRGVLRDFANAAVHFLNAGCNRLDVLADLLRSGRDDIGLRRRFLGVGGHLGADRGQLFC